MAWKHLRDRAGQKHNRLGKYDRNHARGVDPQRNVRGLAAVNPPPDDALGVLHGNFAQALGQQDHKGYYGEHERDEENFFNDILAETAIDDKKLILLIDRVRQLGDDADEDDQRNAVANTALRDLLTQPHDKDRAGSNRQHGRQCKANTRIGNCRLTRVRGLDAGNKKTDAV